MFRRIVTVTVLMLLAVGVLATVRPAHAANATISKVEVYRQYHGISEWVTVWQNGWVNQTVYFDHGSGYQVKITTIGGSGDIYYHLDDTGGSDYTRTTTSSSWTFSPIPDYTNYRAATDGNWLGGSPGNEFRLRPVYSDLIISSKPTPNATAPFCVGQSVEWTTVVKNESDVPGSESTDVGFYLGTSSGDFSAQWDDSGVPRLDGRETSSETSAPYTFQIGDVGTRYVNVWADWDDVEIEDDDDNNKDTSSAFEVNPSPVAAFSRDPSGNIAQGSSVQFTDQSTGNPTSWVWTFGDGGNSTQQSPSHTYNNPGTWTICLTVTNSCGSNQTCETITVDYPEPSAQFSGTPISGTAPLTVNFTNTSSDATNYLWEFGDGDTSTATDPSHTYNSPGQYTVTLTATGPGGSDPETKVNYITVNETVNADFSGSPTSGTAPLTVNFTNLSTGATSYLWEFGDGDTSTAIDPSHTYNSPGTYTVTLTASGPGGSDTETKVSYITGNETVNADFSGSPTSGTAPLTVNFTNLSTGATSYQWNFGDGGSSTAEDPSHTYNSPGTYTVTLTATGPGGSDVEEKADYIDEVTDGNPVVIADVMISNLRDTSVVVSWTTDGSSNGTVEYGTTSSLGSTAFDVRGSGHSGTTHYVSVSGLSPSTTYLFDITSGSTTDDNGGNHYQVTTGPTLGLPASDTVYGQVFKSGGSTPAEGAIVYIMLEDDDGAGSSGQAAKMSALVDSNGYWNANLGNARLGNLSAYFIYSTSSDQLALMAEGAGDGEAMATTATSNDAPAPSMTLGSATCYPLTLNKTGEGSLPVASPTNSVGCSPGEYHEGEVIQLSGASPALGYEISGWTGTDDESLTTPSNQATMPGSAHTVLVHYVSSIAPFDDCVGNTGNNASVAIPDTVTVLGDVPLEPGDELALFTPDGTICAGHGVWDGNSLGITAWGDNDQTQEKDGFAPGEEMMFRLWDDSAGTLYENITVAYLQGNGLYNPNTFHVVGSLEVVTSVTQDIPLAAGWSMISSYVVPETPDVELAMANVASDMVLMKNGDGQVYWPAFGIDQIGVWDVTDGYQIYMTSPATLSITGQTVDPTQTPITLASGWSMVGYLLPTPQTIDLALGGISNELYLAKNGLGEVYWPGFGINQIGDMQPGAGYQLYLTAPGTLVFPANN